MGWPKWNETPASRDLGEVVRKLRNAIAHSNVIFSSDDREVSKVTVTFKSENGNWQAEISAQELKSFCLKFIDLIENETG